MQQNTNNTPCRVKILGTVLCYKCFLIGVYSIFVIRSLYFNYLYKNKIFILGFNNYWMYPICLRGTVTLSNYKVWKWKKNVYFFYIKIAFWMQIKRHLFTDSIGFLVLINLCLDTKIVILWGLEPEIAGKQAISKSIKNVQSDLVKRL